MTSRLPSILILTAVLLIGLANQSAHSAVTVRVQLSTQTMVVSVDGTQLASWPISTARRGYRTPTGTFRPYSLQRMHYSKLYDFTPMPYSVFFHRGYAIHGTYEIRNLGRPVSHGCIRLAPDHAQSLFELIQTQGPQNTSIEILP
ncbi:lipoprotein-anchoring transpeptidase ErfK/SrfK [Bradyrhizobium sp. USDA 326]|uniref:L,D-transpeptidase n=1 Tax=unclassified Bradyrhizobium TaxID=2631580 RepID=UPI003519A9F7